MAATPQPRQTPRNQGGYVLLVLLLMMAVLTIGFLEVTKYDLQYTKQQIQRDREEELIHRGVQYSRAVRRYFKKFGRYPSRIEDLENTNNFRFLRKRYKDPITGKDFKLLRLNDVQFALKPQLAPNPAHAAALATGQQSAPGEQSALDGQRLDGKKLDEQGSDEQNPQSSGVSANDDAQSEAAQSDDPGQQAQTGTGSALPSAQPAVSAAPAQVFGGGPIVGVASLSKAKSVREFNKKDHYNQWQFIYDPSTDTGGLSITPNQPPLRTLSSPGSPSAGN